MKRENINDVIENYLNNKMKVKPIQRKNLSLGNIELLLSFYSHDNEEIEFDAFTTGQLRGQGEIFERLLNSQIIRKDSDAFAFYATVYTMYLNPKLLKNIYVPFMKKMQEKKFFESFGKEFEESISILYPENKSKKDEKIAEINGTINIKKLPDENEE